jgi:phosphate transport system permease protein
MSEAAVFVKSSDSGFRQRLLWSAIFRWLCRIAIYSAILVLVTLLAVVFRMSMEWLDLDFFRRGDSQIAENAGIQAGLWGTFWLISLTAMFSLPVGIGAAVYLEEYAANSRVTRLIKLNLSNLAGVPSIVYGMLGLTVFVRMFGAFGNGVTVNLLGGLMVIPLPFGKTVIAGALTMSLLILPVVIISAQEALRAVPKSIRVGSLALGATRWQTVWHQVLPAASPGIATGAILAISRAIGETAPLIMVGAVTYARICPGGIESVGQLISEPHRIAAAPFDMYTAMPIAIYGWVRRPDPQFVAVAAAGIVVLMVVLTVINGLAVFIRQRARSKVNW